VIDGRTPGGHEPRELTPLATLVEPEVTEARLARQWSALESRGLPGARALSPLARWVFGALFVAPLLAAIGVFAWASQERGLPSGASIESAEGPISVRLRDGSSVELAAQTRLRMLRDQRDEVEIELASGRATFDVTHVDGRAFLVSLGDAQVRVVGTRFEVLRSDRKEGALLQVSVSRGAVEVRRRDEPGGVRKLVAGETWSALVPRVQPGVAAVAAPRLERVAAPVADDARDAPDVPDVMEFEVDELAVSDEEALVDDDDARGGARDRAALARSRARALFQRANLARRAGQMREAEAVYAELLRRFPRDGRAGVSAFELGRIRMDALGNPKGAVAAFSRALALSPDASFREDALARIVVARDAMAQDAACRAARERYLADYPRGVHAVSLAARCK
jgi:transmembrane sensor